MNIVINGSSLYRQVVILVLGSRSYEHRTMCAGQLTCDALCDLNLNKKGHRPPIRFTLNAAEAGLDRLHQLHIVTVPIRVQYQTEGVTTSAYRFNRLNNKQVKREDQHHVGAGTTSGNLLLMSRVVKHKEKNEHQLDVVMFT